MVLLCCGAIFGTTGARAQCPDASTPDPGPPWNGPTTVGPITLPDGCQVTVTYCDRRNDGGSDWEMYIESVQPTTPGCGLPGELITEAFEYFQTHGDRNDIYIPPCGQGTTQTLHEYIVGCWYWTYDANNNPIYYPCVSDAGALCEATCNVCDDNGTLIYTGCTTTGTLANCTLCQPPCTWSKDQCYSLNLCGPN